MILLLILLVHAIHIFLSQNTSLDRDSYTFVRDNTFKRKGDYYFSRFIKKMFSQTQVRSLLKIKYLVF